MFVLNFHLLFSDETLKNWHESSLFTTDSETVTAYVESRKSPIVIHNREQLIVLIGCCDVALNISIIDRYSNAEVAIECLRYQPYYEAFDCCMYVTNCENTNHSQILEQIRLQIENSWFFSVCMFFLFTDEIYEYTLCVQQDLIKLDIGSYS